MPLNLHKLFSGAPEKDYISALAVGTQKEGSLRAARDEIRATIRSALGNLAQFARVNLFEASASASRSLQPKFRMQGSFSYRTCNDPAQKPPQEVDLDDGLFVAVSYLQANGHAARPVLLSKGLFEIVEQTLAPLCEKKGWQLQQKPSCVRVRLNQDAHVDIALYSIPDSEYTTLVEKEVLAADAATRDSLQKRLASDELPDEIYRRLAHSQIMLAHRVEGWKPSDPRKLDEWFRQAVVENGEHLRRVCRYLKGWRDYQWTECRLSSIVLMAAVVEAFRRHPELAKAETRDDKSLLSVCEELSSILSRPIANPVVPGQWLDENWSPEFRAEYVKAAQQLLGYVRSATSNGNAVIAIAELQSGFGERIPDDPKLIADDGGLEIKSAFAAPAIKVVDDGERMRRAEIAARDIEQRGQQSKPWAK
jgi:hypothetical protein